MARHVSGSCTQQRLRTVLCMPDSAAPVSGSLAVRYRPRRFADVVGQAHVKRALQRAVATGQVPRQMLFSGGSGLGKTTLARICAAALLCERPIAERSDGDSCASCSSCRDVITGSHPDVIEIDAASNGRVDEIRELASRAHLAPMRGTVRIYIIDEAHGLSAAGGQAFLKLLEEPPAHVIFMLATTDPERMLHTNRSRCTQFDLSAPRAAEMVENLCRVAAVEGVALQNSAASEIVVSSPPELGVRGTLMALEKVLPLLADGVTVAEALGHPPSELLDALFMAFSRKDPAAALAALTALRSRHPLDKLLTALSSKIANGLVDAVAAADEPAARSLLSAADLLIAARKDGSELAAIATVVKIASIGVDLTVSTATGDATSATPAATPTPIEPSPPQPLSPAPQKVPASSSQGGDVSVSKTSATTPTPISPVEVAGSEYLCDPFNEGLPISEMTADAPEPVHPTLAPAVVDGHDELQRVIAGLATMNTAPARLLAAKLRPATATLSGSELVLVCPPAIRAAIERDHALLSEAAATVGYSVLLG